MRPLANGYHLDLVPVSAEASRAKGGVWVALADVALHHRVHTGATVRALGGMQAAHSLQVEHPRMALRVCSPSRCVSSVLEGVQHCSVQVAFQFCSNVKSLLDIKSASTTFDTRERHMTPVSRRHLYPVI